MRANILGDLRAEADHQMLESAFLETADFRTLIDTTDRPIVVGRRGTGKSALAYRLIRHWRHVEHTDTVVLAPIEEQVIALRALMPRCFGEAYKLIRAGARIAWKYALLAEIAQQLTTHYKLDRADDSTVIRRHAAEWTSLGPDVSTRLRKRLAALLPALEGPGGIAEVAGLLDLASLSAAIASVLRTLHHQVVILIDRVDEGYEPDNTGVAMIDALVLAAIDLNTHFEHARVTLFLRDNMARAVEQLDRDYSRDVEGQVLRLHWEESQLFSLVCNRLRRAFSLEYESDVKVWDRCATRELHGRDGFKKCLRLTLYRPRDILSLLNDAFLEAARDGRTQIIGPDVEHSAQAISRIRLDDLHKEYSAILPGLDRFTSAFKGAIPEMTVEEAFQHVEQGIRAQSEDEAAAQTFELLDTPSDIGTALYSVGFLGVKEPISGVVAFCHDGRMIDQALTQTDRVMVHPCYWLALGIADGELEPGRAAEIFDDYDIRVISQTPELRKARLGQYIGALDRIEVGEDGASDFEDWCLRVIRVIFAVQLTNIELHPNRDAIQRRDVVATNLGRSEFWRRVREDYETRQIIFEVKNFKELGPLEYRQMAAYLGNGYGRLGFIITRDDSENILSDRELPWVKEFYNKNKLLIVKLTGRFFSRILSKMRSPQKHDESEVQLNRLLDQYLRMYLGEHVSPGRRKARAMRNKPQRKS